MRRSQRGIGLVAAIFLIVVVAALTVAMARLVRSGGTALAQEVLAQRAFLAAESGAQLALNRVFAPAGAGACGTWSWDLDTVELPGCRAEVSCRSDLVDGVPHYTLESDGRCRAGEASAERRILVRAVP
jgi:MSHA biogenesis protein MshP